MAPPAPFFGLGVVIGGRLPLFVIPAHAGIHGLGPVAFACYHRPHPPPWIPTFVGMTKVGAGRGNPFMRDVFQPCVYILASRRHGTLYIGVTSNLLARLIQHREGLIPGFTKAYGVHILVWYEVHATMEAAIVREKRLKEWRRAWKIELIEAQNEDWGDLGVGLGLAPLPPVPTKESMT